MRLKEKKWFSHKKTLCIEEDSTKNRLALVKTNRAFFWSVFFLFEQNTEKYGPGKSPYLDTFDVMVALLSNFQETNFNGIVMNFFP